MPMLTSDKLKERDRLNKRLSAMKVEASSFMDHYMALSEFVDPRRGRFFVTDRNRGEPRHKSIYNSKPALSLRTASAGMLAGAMSPARPWFQFTSHDEALVSNGQARRWAALLRKLVLLILGTSNFYNMAPLKIRELMLFGTGCMSQEDDFEDVVRFYTHTVGSYYIDQSNRLSVNAFAREFERTTLQLVMQFGLENVSTTVKSAYDSSNYHSWHPVVQFIEPNMFRDPDDFTSRSLEYRSVYYEPRYEVAGKFLSESGFSFFPVYASRWETTNEDILGTSCPGMLTLGDVKQLQKQEKEKAKAIEKHVTPPMQGPPSFRNQPVRNLPGGYTTNMGAGGKIESLYNLDPRIQELVFDIQTTERRISEGFYVPLFKAITEMEGIQPKNQVELSHVNAERLLELGPVLEQVHGEWLGKMVENTVRRIFDLQLMPPAPEILQGRELDLEFISALAVAQRAVATGSIERTVTFAAGLAEAGWDVRDRINADEVIDEYSSVVGAPPKIVVPVEEVEAKRRERQQQMQSDRAFEQAQQAANVAKMASDAKLDDDNALSVGVGRR